MLAAPLVGDLEMQAQAGGDVLAVGSVGSAWTPISVREFTGKIHPLAVDVNRSGLDQDVSDLKAKVQTATGVTPDAQCLIIEGGDGKPLDDDTKKLRACVGLKSGALVHLTMQDEEKGRARREEHKVAREAKEAKWLAKVRVGSIVGVVDDDDQVGVVAQMPTTSTSFARCRWEDGTESSHRLERLRPPSVQEKAEAASWVAAETWRRQRQKAKHMMKLTLGFAVLVVLPATLVFYFGPVLLEVAKDHVVAICVVVFLLLVCGLGLWCLKKIGDGLGSLFTPVLGIEASDFSGLFPVR